MVLKNKERGDKMKAVIFDMDGVLIDSEPLYYEVEHSIYDELGVQIEDERYAQYVGSSAYKMYSDLKEEFHFEADIEELIQKTRERIEEIIEIPGKLKLIEGVIPLLQWCKEKEYKTAIASSSHDEMIQKVVDIVDIRQYFDTLVSGDFVKKSKPNPDIFLYAAKKLEVKPQNCIVIEDSSNGVKAANRAGMKCIGFQSPNTPPQNLEIADQVVVHMTEIINILK